jgi:hypothetical protein
VLSVQATGGRYGTSFRGLGIASMLRMRGGVLPPLPRFALTMRCLGKLYAEVGGGLLVPLSFRLAYRELDVHSQLWLAQFADVTRGVPQFNET